MNKYLEKIAANLHKEASTRLGRENLAKYVSAMGKAKTEGIAQAALHGGDKVLVGSKMPISKKTVVNEKALIPGSGAKPFVDGTKLGIDSVKHRMRGRMPDGSTPKGMINTRPATPHEIGDSLRGDTMGHLQAIAAKG